jgi:hypothetical protein
MYRKLYWTTAFLGLFGGLAQAQTIERRANFTGGGGPQGRCTIEVVVDGAAEVEIRGDRALLRNVYGQPPQWRRFECTSPMPSNPANFRFQGVDGRGSQKLIGDPSRGGRAIVRIDDPDNGSEGYTFNVFWQGGGLPPQGGPGFPGRGYRRLSVDDAVRICQDAVRAQANDRLRGVPIDFRRTGIDNQPGRQDWVVGTFEVRRGPGRPDLYSFSCSVDFVGGRVRSADFQRANR